MVRMENGISVEVCSVHAVCSDVMPASLVFCGRTCEVFVLMVAVLCSWWTDVLKLRNALSITCV